MCGRMRFYIFTRSVWCPRPFRHVANGSCLCYLLFLCINSNNNNDGNDDDGDGIICAWRRRRRRWNWPQYPRSCVRMRCTSVTFTRVKVIHRVAHSVPHTAAFKLLANAFSCVQLCTSGVELTDKLFDYFFLD